MNAMLRIAELFDEMSKHSDPNVKMSDLFALKLHTVFESAQFYVAIGALIEQFERGAANALELEKHERARAVNARAIDKLRPWLHPHTIRSQTVSGMGQIAPEIDQLFVIGSQLPSEDDAIEPAIIEQALAEAYMLQQTLAELDIDPATRLYLMRLVDMLIMALRSVDTIGVEGLSRVFGSFASEIARVSGTVVTGEAATWISGARKWAGKIGKGVLWTAAFVSAGSHAITDASDVVTLITGPETGHDSSKDSK